MPSSCPGPDVSPKDTVQFEENFLRTSMFVVVCPSGDDTIKISD